MEKQERLFTIGELARMSGVTVRTLQYYDEQDLLKPIITEVGRRKYTREDVLRLEQILFLKSLGFSLDEINKKILDLNTSSDFENIFAMQRNALTGQIEQLNNIVGMLDAAIAETKTDQEINMDRLIAIMESMKRGNPYAFVVRYFNDEQLKSFAIQLFTMPDNLDVKEVSEKLTELYEKGVNPEGKEGQELAKRWWSMVNEFSSGDTNLLKSLIDAGLDIQNWPDEAKDIQEPIKNFLVKALNIYIHNNSLQRTTPGNGRMEINKFPPSDLLQNSIDYIWAIESDFLTDEKREDIIMPLGHINIIFNYASDYKLIEDGKDILIPNAAVIGQIKNAKNVRYGQKLEQIGISLKPAGSISLLKMPGSIITERIIDVNEVDLTLNELYYEIKELNGIEQKIKKIYEYLETKIVFNENSQRIAEMTYYIECNCEKLNVCKMAEFFNISLSALERFFKKNVGLTPKTYGNIFKFRKNIEDNTLRKNLQSCYYDQSHLIKNTKKLSGKTANELEDVEKELTLHYLLNSKEKYSTIRGCDFISD